MRYTRPFAALAAVSSVALALSACAGSRNAPSASADLSAASGAMALAVGASKTPHAKILSFVDKELADDVGLHLVIKDEPDYELPNEALEAHDIDVNYFQTAAYLEFREKDRGYDFQAGKGIHIEPMGIYSVAIDDLKDFPEGGVIGIIPDAVNQERALRLLADNGFVSLPAGEKYINVETVEKLKDFTFKEVESPELVRSLADVDLAVINGNLALEGGLSLSEDALAYETGDDEANANVLVWRSDVPEDKLADIKKLDELLHFDEVKKYIEKTWPDGSVVPAF